MCQLINAANLPELNKSLIRLICKTENNNALYILLHPIQSVNIQSNSAQLDVLY